MRVKEESEKVGLKLNIWKTKIMTSDPINSWQTEREKVGAVPDFLFSVSKITVDDDCSHEIKRRLLIGRKVMTNLESIIKSRDITLLTKVKAMVSPVVVYVCDNWAIKKAECWRVDAFKLWCWRRLLKALWTASGEITPVNPKGNKPWIFVGRIDAEAPILWPPDAKSQLIRKDCDAGKDWRQEEKGTSENELVGCHHWLNGREFEQVLGYHEGQVGLACCSPWGHKELDTTERLNKVILD